MYYYRSYYDTTLEQVVYASYGGNEYFTISDYIPLEENEHIIDFLVLKNPWRRLYEIYVLTDMGNVYISNSFVDEMSSTDAPTYPDETITFDELHDVTDWNTNIPITKIVESYSSIMIFYENGDMTFTYVREEGEVRVDTDLFIPLLASFYSTTFTVYSDIDELIRNHFQSDDFTIYSVYPGLYEYIEPTEPPTTHLTYFTD